MAQETNRTKPREWKVLLMSEPPGGLRFELSSFRARLVSCFPFLRLGGAADVVSSGTDTHPAPKQQRRAVLLGVRCTSCGFCVNDKRLG